MMFIQNTVIWWFKNLNVLTCKRPIRRLAIKGSEKLNLKLLQFQIQSKKSLHSTKALIHKKNNFFFLFIGSFTNT